MDSVYTELRREYNNLEMLWNPEKNRRMRELLNVTTKLIDTWYPDNTRPDSVDEIINNYYSQVYNEKGEIKIKLGYSFYCHQVNEFLANPNSMWEFYDQNKDKIDFRECPTFIRFTSNKEENKKMFFVDMISFFLKEMNISPAILDMMDDKMRKSVLEVITNHYKNHTNKLFYSSAKEELILDIKSTLERLDELGVIDTNRKQHNEKMDRLGLNFFIIDEDLPCLEGNNLFGADLNACSILQLEAMLCFYRNRIEKVRETIGFGLFVFREQNSKGKLISDSISDDELKEHFKKFSILSQITNDVFEELYNLEEASNWEIGEEEIGKTLIKYVSKYADGFSDIFYSNDGRELSEDEKESNQRRFFYDVISLSMGDTNFRLNNYLIKSRLLEDIIVQCNEQKLNWGIMEEDGEIRLRNKVLIGADIPGLNASLRVHHDLNELKKLMHRYYDTEDVPIFVGSDDYNTRGRSEGTQFLLPLKKDELAAIKYYAKDKGKLSQVSRNFVKHIACMQMPNPLKRILSEKKGKTQKIPDSVNIFKKKINKAPRYEEHEK